MVLLSKCSVEMQGFISKVCAIIHLPLICGISMSCSLWKVLDELSKKQKQGQRKHDTTI